MVVKMVRLRSKNADRHVWYDPRRVQFDQKYKVLHYDRDAELDPGYRVWNVWCAISRHLPC